MAPLGVSFYPQGLSYTAVMTLGKMAEDHGFDSVFGVEGGVSNDVMATVEALALATQRITVGTGIANLYLRHAALLGAGAVAIDELSGGRLILGIGVNHAAMIQALGLPWRDPRQALRDTTHWLRMVFAGETPQGVRTPLRPARHPIPIHFAGVALETAELAGEIADGLMCYLAPAQRFTQMVQRMRRGVQHAGRSPDAVTASLLLPTFLDHDVPAAREAARRFLVLYASAPLYRSMFRRYGFIDEVNGIDHALERQDRAAVAAAISDRLLDAVCLIGPRTRCQEHLAAFEEAGLTYAILAPQAVRTEPEQAIRDFLTTFAR